MTMTEMNTPTAPCPYAGQGGSYTLDPATGQRVLTARTDMPAAVPPAPTIDAAVAAPAKPMKKGA